MYLRCVKTWRKFDLRFGGRHLYSYACFSMSVEPLVGTLSDCSFHTLCMPVSVLLSTSVEPFTVLHSFTSHPFGLSPCQSSLQWGGYHAVPVTLCPLLHVSWVISVNSITLFGFILLCLFLHVSWARGWEQLFTICLFVSMSVDTHSHLSTLVR